MSGTVSKNLGSGTSTGRTLINNGATTLGGGDSADLNISSSGSTDPGSVFINNGTFNAVDDADIGLNNFGGSGQPAFNNAASGIFNKNGASTTTQIATAFNNSGTVNVNAGTLEAAAQFTQTAGSLNLLGGTITGTVPLNIQGGLLTGSGTIANAVTNIGGTISPGSSAGSITITGNLTLGNNSNLSIELGGVAQGTQYDFLSEAGTAALTLDGNLTLHFINGFQNTVTASDTFTILTSNQNLAGAFDNVANGARLNVTNLPGSFQVNYGAGSPFGAQNVVLSAFVIPEPSSAFSLALGLGALGIRRRRSASP
jgi:hypothetical protein